MDGGGGRYGGRGRGGGGGGGRRGGGGGRGGSSGGGRGSFHGDAGGRGGRGGGGGGRGGFRRDNAPSAPSSFSSASNGFGGGGRGRGGRSGGVERQENGFGGGGGARGGKRGNAGPPQAALNLDEAFCMMVHAQLQELVEDGTRNEMSFPSDLDNHQRRYIHSVAEKYGLFTKSSGKGDSRFIHVAKVKKNANMQQISLRLPPIKVNTATMAWFPPPVIQYLQQFPLAPVPSNQDAWASGELTPSWKAHHVLGQHQRVSQPLFKPLRQNARPSQSPKTRPKSNGATLPVHSYREQILEYVERNQVVVISGDTGCGKSTQIPQFLLDDMIAKGKGGETRIICSQPRRLSAISLAERVVKERAGLGGDPIEVGHAIRFDSSFDSHKSKLIFCTTGTLLKWLNSDPLAQGFSHLILDEVHERDQFTDFLLILLKSSILKRRKDLKVILMSATIQVEKFAQYFQPEFDAPILEMVGGRCFPVTTLFLEDVLALIHHANTSGGASAITQHASRGHENGEENEESDEEEDALNGGGLQCPMCQTGGFSDEEAFGMHVATCFGVPPDTLPNPPKVKKAKKPQKEKKPTTVKASRQPAALGDMLRGALDVVSEDVKTNLLSNYVRQEDALSRDQSVDYSLLLQLLYMIEQVFPLHDADSQGAILVFLPGWEEISYMERELLRSHMTASTYEIAMLHSRLSAQEQRRAFLKPPRGKRKLILATNIAETSLTIEDVVFVIDCGKSKQAHALATTSSSSFVMGLQTTWVAKANCVQRMGRAGRVRPGVCFRLFSKSRYETAMKEFMIPELLTTPLEELMLHIKLLQFEKKLHIQDAKEFLMLAMDSPSENAIDASLDRLEVMSALDRSKNLTLLGWHLAHICDSGVSVHVGKLLLWSHVFGEFDAIVRTTCALSGYRDPFLNFLGMTGDELRQVEASKQGFLREAGTPFSVQSDHFVLLLAMEGYLQFHPRAHSEIDMFCRRNMLHRPTLDQVTSIYRQLERDLEQLGMTEVSQLVGSSTQPQVQRQQQQGQFANRRHQSAPTARWSAQRLAPFFMALGAGLYPNVLSTRPIPGSRNWTSKEKVKVRLDSSSMLNKGGNGASSGRGKKGKPGQDDDDDDETSGNGLEWMVYHEMMQSERTRVAKNATKLPTPLILLLFVGNADHIEVEESQIEVESPSGDGALVSVSKWTVVIDEWLVFEFGSMEEVQAVLTLRARLQAAFYRHLDRLHESHLLVQQQQRQDLPPRGRTANGTAQPPPVTATPELPHDPMRDVWRQHDAQLVAALVGWITSDLPPQ